MSIPVVARRPDPRRRVRGQSLVELALVAPVLLLIVLVAIDFGRVFLGWVNLQQMARLAANYAAEHASAWVPPGDSAVIARYRTLVTNDARKINCVPQAPIPDPIVAGTGLGAQVKVEISCQFSVITPIISQVLGGTILASASTTFPVKEGAVAVVPGGGGPPIPVPVAKFVGSPQSGWGPLTVTFTDQSTGAPTSWTWDFSVNASGAGVGSVSPSTSLAQGPHTVTYSCNGNPGDVCRFGVSLDVSNVGGSDNLQRDNYITVTVPPADGPIAEFTGTPRSGTEPLPVDFQFVEVPRSPAVNYTAWVWDFGDGTPTASGASVSHTFADEGAYDISLTVTGDGTDNSLTKVGYIVVNRRICTVPDFANVRRNNAQALWVAAGFTTQVGFMPGPPNYRIHQQTLVGGTIDPQPLGCDSTIIVGP